MSKLLLIFLTLIFGLLFLLIPQTESYDLFLFSDIKLTVQTHIYFICEKLTMIVLAWIIASESTQYRTELKAFFWLMVADLLDYCLSYGSIWFNVGVVPVSMNTAKVFIFAIVIFNAWLKRL